MIQITWLIIWYLDLVIWDDKSLAVLTGPAWEYQTRFGIDVTPRPDSDTLCGSRHATHLPCVCYHTMPHHHDVSTIMPYDHNVSAIVLHGCIASTVTPYNCDMTTTRPHSCDMTTASASAIYYLLLCDWWYWQPVAYVELLYIYNSENIFIESYWL